jgi:hypothetical protein
LHYFGLKEGIKKKKKENTTLEDGLSVDWDAVERTFPDLYPRIVATDNRHIKLFTAATPTAISPNLKDEHTKTVSDSRVNQGRSIPNVEIINKSDKAILVSDVQNQEYLNGCPCIL